MMPKDGSSNQINYHEKLLFLGVTLLAYGVGLLMNVPVPGLFIGLGLGFIMLARRQSKK